MDTTPPKFISLDVVALRDGITVFGVHVARGKGFHADIVESQLPAVRAMVDAGDVQVFGATAAIIAAQVAAEAAAVPLAKASKNAPA